VFKDSDVWKRIKELFSFFQYMLADSAFACSQHVIPAYKKPRGGNMSRSNERFNDLMKPCRVWYFEGTIPASQSHPEKSEGRERDARNIARHCLLYHIAQHVHGNRIIR